MLLPGKLMVLWLIFFCGLGRGGRPIEKKKFFRKSLQGLQTHTHTHTHTAFLHR